VTNNELTHVLRFRAAFAIAAVIGLIIGLIFYGGVGAVTILSWSRGTPIAISADVALMLKIGLWVQGAGSVILWRVVQFYFPKQP
jgi:hypothetical protein